MVTHTKHHNPVYSTHSKTDPLSESGFAMPRQKNPSFPVMNPPAMGQNQLCPPLSSIRGKSNSEPSMREQSQAARSLVLAAKEEGRMLSTFSLNDNRSDQPRCDICLTTDTPEWRKGPNGPRTLCNACGLRYSKQVRKTDQPKKERSYEWFMYQAPDKVVKVDSSNHLLVQQQQLQHQLQLQQQQLQQQQRHSQGPQSIQQVHMQGISLSGPMTFSATPSPASRIVASSPSCLVQAMAPLSLTAKHADMDPIEEESMDLDEGGEKMKIGFILN